MNNNVLTINTIAAMEGQNKTLDSREVAEMMGKAHGDLLKDIQGSGKNLGIIPVLTKGNFPVVDYFMESVYKDAKGENRKCYLITKMGCEVLGNKLQGEKGILFTAMYVKRFNEMESTINKVDNSIKTKGKLNEFEWNKIKRQSIYLTEEIHDRKSIRKYIREYNPMQLDECIDHIADILEPMKGSIKHELLDVAIKELKEIDAALMKDTIKHTYIKDTAIAGIVMLQDIKIGKQKRRISQLEQAI